MGSQNTTNGEKQLLVKTGLLILANEDVLSFSECMIPLRCTSIHKIGPRVEKVARVCVARLPRVFSVSTSRKEHQQEQVCRGDSDMFVFRERGVGSLPPSFGSCLKSRFFCLHRVCQSVSLSKPDWGSRPGTFPAWPGPPASSRHPPCLPACSAEG